LEGAALDGALRSVGLRLGRASPPEIPADIELTLVSAARAALPHEYRLLGVVCAWLEVHHARVNVPKLLRALEHAEPSVLERALWSTLARWLGAHDARWRTLERLYQGEPLTLEDAEVTALQLERVGSDPRFAGGTLRVHAKLLRSRREDVDSPAELAARHPGYRRRLEFGASYRADVWVALDQEPAASAAEIARRVGCAYETARSVQGDWRIVRAARQATDA
jgi:hypothetical protein